MKVFLGGTCNGSLWRNELISMLNVPFFNPVVEDWTPECQAEEVRQREICSKCLYVITPKMTGVFSIAELTEDSIQRPSKTLVCFLREDGDARFTDAQWKSLAEVRKIVERNGAVYRDTLQAIAYELNDPEQ